MVRHKVKDINTGKTLFDASFESWCHQYLAHEEVMMGRRFKRLKTDKAADGSLTFWVEEINKEA